MTTVLVSGALANKPLNGGEAWVRLSWLRGLRALGVNVCFVEQIASSACTDIDGNPAPFEHSINRDYFETVTAAFAPDCPSALVCEETAVTAGCGFAEMVERARDADLLVNISGHLTMQPIRSGPRRSAYIDVDPGFTQIWAASGTSGARLDGHDRYFTVGGNIGSPNCSIPRAGIDWRPLPPPVTLEDWPVLPAPDRTRFTTVATWRSPLGCVAQNGVAFPGKHHQWRRVLALPRLSRQRFEIALDIHEGDAADREALVGQGWRLANPRSVAGDPDLFRSYVQGSSAEFSVAHGVYVETSSGWVSDRTVRYLASGRPALVQDTGITQRYAGEGLVTFREVDDAAAAADRIAREYDSHASAARALAHASFDARHVLARFLDEMGVV
jgi:hypothetical protein